MANLAQRIGQEFKTLRDNELSLKLNTNANQEIVADIVPALADTYTLGTIEKPFKDLYVGANSLYVNGQQVISDNSGTIVVSADSDQNIQLKTEGSGDIEFLPNGTGTIQFKGNIVLSAGATISTAGGSNVMEALELTGSLKGPQTFTIDPAAHGDNTGTVIIAGNLQVDGTTTTLNSVVLTINDKAIVVADGAATAAEANGAGIIVSDGTIANFTYNASDNAFKATVDMYANGYKVITTDSLAVAESTIASNLASEATFARAAESTLQVNINNEIVRASAAESVNASAIASEVTRATAAESTIASDLVVEATRATAAESVNASAIASEVTRATAADSVNASAIAAEATRATAAENVIASNLTAEIARATAAESTNASAIAAEATRATAAESALNSSVTVERGRIDAILLSADADKDSFAEIVSLINSVDQTNDTAFATYVSTNNSALASEVTRATAAESTNASSITSEVNRATAAESTNASAIASEVTRAQAAESTNASAIAEETTRATSAESTLQVNIDNLAIDDVVSGTSGDILYHNGTGFVKLPKGTNGQILTLVNGLPAWTNMTIG